MRYFPSFVDLVTGYTSSITIAVLGITASEQSNTSPVLTQICQTAVALATIGKLAYDVYLQRRGKKNEANPPFAMREKKGLFTRGIRNRLKKRHQ